ncbi:MAG: DUF5671 domain-containing protein [Pseudomonadota bacterium]
MAAQSELQNFVRDALTAGRSRDEIRQAMAAAGWSDRETTEALAAFAVVHFVPPVPRPHHLVSARDAFIYAVLFTALAFSAGYLVTLVHAALDLWIADNSDGSTHDQRAIRRVQWAIAVLLVAGPVYIWLTVLTNRKLARDPGHRRSAIRKWLTYLTLFIAALIFFSDAIYVLYNFFRGEVTPRFVLKALTVAAVAGAVFTFYLRMAEEPDTNNL